MNTSKLLPLQPWLDREGQMRCDGRLKYTEFLDTLFLREFYVAGIMSQSWLSSNTMKKETMQVERMMLAALSSQFWLISLCEEIREGQKEFNECCRWKAKTAKQIMTPLPQMRLQLSGWPFAQPAVDFVGPFITIQGRGFQRQKRYLCLFTCLATRAVHLEMAFSLDTDSFLNTFYRMVKWRRLPREMLSDDGTNFVAAERELRELVAVLEGEKIAQWTAKRDS